MEQLLLGSKKTNRSGEIFLLISYWKNKAILKVQWKFLHICWHASCIFWMCKYIASVLEKHQWSDDLFILLQKLRQVFAENELPSRTIRENLSKQLGLNSDKVSIIFSLLDFQKLIRLSSSPENITWTFRKLCRLCFYLPRPWTAILILWQ